MSVRKMGTNGCLAHKKIKSKHFTESFVSNGNVIISLCLTKLMEETTMYTPIDAKYIIAYFENPIQLSQLLRMVQYKTLKRRRMRRFTQCTA